MQVFDDQADYFANASSVWLTEEEREREQQLHAQRVEERKRRPGMAISFDIAGRRVLVRDGASTGNVEEAAGVANAAAARDQEGMALLTHPPAPRACETHTTHAALPAMDALFRTAGLAPSGGE